MAKIAEDIRELIGNTPLIDLKGLCRQEYRGKAHTCQVGKAEPGGQC